ncbi:MAG: CBS domain-containing protein [Hydrogenophilales bacterium 28-61-23]|nr:MAG: CBS domain-containing protein [Hydrogenophilales bacterium 28-61-23]
MFYVHGVSGQTFRGSLEKLIAVPGLSAVRRTRAINREGEEPEPELRLIRRDNNEVGQYQQAAQAYREMLRVPTERDPILHAYQLMSRDVMTLRPDTGVDEAWRQLAARGLSQAPVLDKTHQLVGLVTAQNLLTVINLEDGKVRDILAHSVADVMTTPVVSADPITDIRRVARVLLDYHLPGLPVVSEQTELVGIITRSDILRALVNDPPLSLWA